jgi:hypothetical protein
VTDILADILRIAHNPLFTQPRPAFIVVDANLPADFCLQVDRNALPALAVVYGEEIKAAFKRFAREQDFALLIPTAAEQRLLAERVATTLTPLSPIDPVNRWLVTEEDAWDTFETAGADLGLRTRHLWW